VSAARVARGDSGRFSGFAEADASASAPLENAENSVRIIISAASSRLIIFAGLTPPGDRFTKYRGSPGRGRASGDDIGRT